MARYCEITHKKESVNKEGKKPSLLKRKIQIQELNQSVRILVSENGLKKLKEVGGLGKFIKSKEEKQLTPKLKKFKKVLGDEPKPEEPKEEIKEPTEDQPAAGQENKE